jgi:hypothetical protein
MKHESIAMEIPEETRELTDVTIRARETSPGRFEATFSPTSPTHPARQGFTVDTSRGARGKTLGPRPVKWCTRLSASSSPDVYAAAAIAISSSGSSAGSVSAFVIDSALM